VEDRQARAQRWIEASNTRISTVEPEWWLRMMCGQLAQEVSVPGYTGVRHLLRRLAAPRNRHRVRR
jgi:hypothetical protein